MQLKANTAGFWGFKRLSSGYLTDEKPNALQLDYPRRSVTGIPSGQTRATKNLQPPDAQRVSHPGLQEQCELTLVSLGKLPSVTGESPVPPLPPIAERCLNYAPASECFGWHGQPARSAGQLAQWKRKHPRIEGHRNFSPRRFLLRQETPTAQLHGSGSG